jgi:hypothetical protein
VIEADRKLASSEPYLVVMIELSCHNVQMGVRYTRRSHQFVVTFLGFPLFIYGELIVENLLRRSELEEVVEE